MFPASHCFITDEMTFAGIGQSLAMDALEDEFLQQGGTIYYNNVAKQLTRDGVANGTSGRVDGVIAQNEQGEYVLYKASKAVVLATGDFSRDRDMLAKYCPQAIDMIDWEKAAYWDEEEATTTACIPRRAPACSTATATRWGLWVGAAWQKTVPVRDERPGQLGLRHAALRLSPRPHGEQERHPLQQRGLQRRCRVHGAADSRALRPRASGASTMPRTRRRGTPLVSITATTPVPTEEIIAGWDQNVEAGSYFKCDTLEELCEKLGLPVEQTVATVERYNELCDGGRDLDFFKKGQIHGPQSTRRTTARGTPCRSSSPSTAACARTPTCRCATRTTRQSPPVQRGHDGRRLLLEHLHVPHPGPVLRLVPDLRLPHRQVHRRERVALGLAAFRLVI